MRRPTTGVLAGALAVVALALASLVVVWPQALGLAGVLGVAHLVALRGTVAVAALAGAGVLTAGWAVLRRASPGANRSRRLTVALAVWLTAIGVAQAAVLLARGPVGLLGAEPGPADEDAFVVLVLNTEDGVSAADLADLVAQRRADVVALPETTEQTARRAAELLAADGRSYQALAAVGTGGANPSTAVLVADRVGSYTVTEVGPAATVVVSGTGPRLTVVHASAPVEVDLSDWAISGLAAVRACEADPSGIVAGDLNSTLDHPAFADLGGCLDAASAAGAGGVGTWPTLAPRALGAPIDHVLVHPQAWAVRRAAVLEPPPGTDHRAVEAVLEAVG